MELIENTEKKVKVISLLDHEYIFIQVQNSIHIHETIKFNLIEKIYLDTQIKSFEVNEKNLSVIILTAAKTSNELFLYETKTEVMKDYYINFK